VYSPLFVFYYKFLNRPFPFEFAVFFSHEFLDGFGGFGGPTEPNKGIVLAHGLVGIAWKPHAPQKVVEQDIVYLQEGVAHPLFFSSTGLALLVKHIECVFSLYSLYSIDCPCRLFDRLVSGTPYPNPPTNSVLIGFYPPLVSVIPRPDCSDGE